MTDPRPDLKSDSSEWTKVLAAAEQLDPMLAGALHGFRCGGLRLHRGRNGWCFQPDYDPLSSNWENKSEYVRDSKQWLGPYAREISILLRYL